MTGFYRHCNIFSRFVEFFVYSFYTFFFFLCQVCVVFLLIQKAKMYTRILCVLLILVFCCRMTVYIYRWSTYVGGIISQSSQNSWTR